ncbi:MAG TPA: dienelactone hydrolase family protein [Candidatus Limnocylindrales bacterium]|nr:dienelactone hydrolase family protein [Candidatus Limnocylindrales bacterium]
MTEISLMIPTGTLATYIATPDGSGPWPGVVVIHDALGMSQDVRRQADWLAREGYLAAAPDLFDGKDLFRCMRSVLRDYSRGSGPMFDKVEAVRRWLAGHEGSSGKVGLIGFCFGGGFALMLAPNRGFSAASANYGPLPKNAEAFLQAACPIVASYGAHDGTLKGASAKLESILTLAGVPHDVKEYPDAAHAFMNDHHDDRFPFYISALSLFFGGGGYHEPSALDSQRRIIAFFDEHLKAVTAP